MNCIKLSYVINTFIIYFDYVFVYLYLFRNLITHSLCVCVWADCHFVSGESAYNEFHAGD